MKPDKMTIKGLGTFKQRHWLYQTVINKCKAILYNVDPKKSIKHAKIVEDTKNRLELMEAVKVRMSKQLVIRYLTRKIRTEYDELVAQGKDPYKKLEEDIRRLEEPEESKRLHREYRQRTVGKVHKLRTP